jgi:Sulfotransferase domain
MDSWKQRAEESFEEYIQLELKTLWKLRLSNVPAIPVSEWSSLDATKDHLFEIPDHNMTEEEELHANWMVYRQRHMRNYLQRGIYSVQLERWKKYFPLGESLMVINNERLNQEPRKVMTEVLTWLGVPSKDYFMNPNVSVSFDSEGNKVLKNMSLPGKTDGLTRLLSVGRYEPMSTAARGFLEKFYKPYNAELGRILGEEWEGVWDLE